jgi:RNA polymerase sigma-70 factor (ECF subfamily)
VEQPPAVDPWAVEPQAAQRPTDQSLIAQIARQELPAFDEFYRRHAQVTYNLILRIVRDQSLADDIAQETFWQVWKKAAAYKGDGQVVAWLYRIARNKSLDALRRQKARREAPEAHPLEAAWSSTRALPFADSSAAPGGSAPRGRGSDAYAPPVEDLILTELERTQVQHALHAIPVEQRRCLELAYFEGMSQQQIAQHTQQPLGTVKTRIRMGLAKLEHILRGLGYQQEEL